MSVADRAPAPSSVADQVVGRSVARAADQARTRAEREVRALVDAGMQVLRRAGASALTVADVLEEAGLSTRAFYRHFATKDELLLAIYEREARASHEQLRRRVDAASSPRAALETWVDENLALVFDARRARRTRALAAEGRRLHAEFPDAFAAITEGVLEPLRAILLAGRADGSFPSTDPEADARSVHAVVWGLAEDRLFGAEIERAWAREHALRFCLGALGAPS
jgi:AcrR family transcriptional regulator